MWARELGNAAFRTVKLAQREAARGEVSRHSDAELKDRGREASSHFERALALSTSDHARFQVLPDCAEAALFCDQLEVAQRYADETIALAPRCLDDRHRADLVHMAHVVRGHVALTSGNVAAAKRELEAAGAQGSDEAPVLRSFGPDFDLAQRLLDAGEIDAVQAYLDRCATFWRPERVSKWKQSIARGERPRMHTGFEPGPGAPSGGS